MNVFGDEFLQSSIPKIYKDNFTNEKKFQHILQSLDDDELVSLVFLVLKNESLINEAFNHITYITREGRREETIRFLWNTVAITFNGAEIFFYAFYSMGYCDILEEIGLCSQHNMKEICLNSNSIPMDRLHLYYVFNGLTTLLYNKLVQRLIGSQWNFGPEDELMESIFCRNLTSKSNYSLRITELHKALNEIEDAHSLAALLSPFVINIEERIYPLPLGYPHGLCIIINVKHFMEPRSMEDNIPLATRHGSEIDKYRLRATFMLFGFQVYQLDDPDYGSLQEFFHMLRINAKLAILPALAICFMSHGDEHDQLFLRDRRAINIDELRNLCQGFSLLAKPKMIFIQACRGDEKLKPVFIERDGVTVTTRPADCIISASTVHGFTAVRSQSEGSWYITDLCSSLQKYGHTETLNKVLQETRIKLNERVGNLDGSPVTMMSEDKSTLKKDIQLVRADVDHFVDGIVELMIFKLVYENLDELLDCILN